MAGYLPLFSLPQIFSVIRQQIKVALLNTDGQSLTAETSFSLILIWINTKFWNYNKS